MKGDIVEIKDLKVLFDNGGLKTATITNAMFGAGYIVVFDAKDKSKQYQIEGQRKRGEPRVFKTIDAAANNIREIGFQTLSVVFQH